LDLLDKKSDRELLKSLLAEIAKTSNEVKCAQTDLNKAQNRLGFVILLTNILLERLGD